MKHAIGLGICLGAALLVGACKPGGGALGVEKVEPPQGTIVGGEEITILGSGFQPGRTQAEVRFGRKKADSVIIAAANKIKVVTPAGDKGPVDITVAFDDGRAFKIPNGFRYMEPADGESARRAFFSGGNKAGGPRKIEIEEVTKSP
jgi:hypothetical protein